MPRRLLTHPDHDRLRGLGRLAVWWMETFTVHGPGGAIGQPTRFTLEDAGFIFDCYALDEDGRRYYDSAFFSRPKGCDKSGKAAKIALFEALGPCRFAGFAKGGETYEFLGHTYVYSPGEVMGKPQKAPLVRVIATEEDQIKLGIYRVIHYNLSDENAPLSALQGYGMDVGLQRTQLPWSGQIIPSTASAASKDGGLETFVVFDETHLYTTPQLREMYDVVTRNLEKRRGEGAWFIETTTMYAQGADSVAETTYEFADDIAEGKALKPTLLFDHRWGELVDDEGNPLEFVNIPGDTPEAIAAREQMERSLRAAIIDAYGDALTINGGWIDLEGKVKGAYDTRRTITATMRYTLNRLYDVKEQWLPSDYVHQAETRGRTTVRPLEDGDMVTMGFDGSINNDSTVLVLCRVEDALIVPWHLQELPDGPEAEGWEVNKAAVDGAVDRAFERFDVVGFYADPPKYQDYVDAWAIRYEDRLRVKAGKHAVEWFTGGRLFIMFQALDRFRDAMVDGAISLGQSTVAGAPRVASLVKHLRNGRMRANQSGYGVFKEAPKSPKKIDLAIGAVLAYEARADYLHRGAKPSPKKKRRVIRAR